MQSNLLYASESYKIRGAILEVYHTVGIGFLESVYQECLERELALAGVPFVVQQELGFTYKGILLKQTFRCDFICYDKLIIEIKAVQQLVPEHTAQVLDYLNLSRMKLGLLVNFCAYPGVDIKRIVR
ncbi:GxxExxY protein [Verrucomicrobia bacterium LW23]|nr:GxxExxY protein [Verrucomicrobia bacterium LW23]